jgi:hypothetical protein
MGERRGACQVLLGKPVGRRPLGRPRHRCEVNIKLDLQGVVFDWIDLTWDRDRCRAVVNAVMNLQVPSIAGNFLGS